MLRGVRRSRTVRHDRRCSSSVGRPAARPAPDELGRPRLRAAPIKAICHPSPLCSLRLAAQDVALSRRKQGFESPRERQYLTALCSTCATIMHKASRRLLWPYSQNFGHTSPMTTFNSYGTVSQHRQAEILKPIRFRLRRPFAFSCGHRAAESDAQALDRLLGTMSVFTVGVRPRSGAKFSEIVIRKPEISISRCRPAAPARKTAPRSSPAG